MSNFTKSTDTSLFHSPVYYCVLCGDKTKVVSEKWMRCGHCVMTVVRAGKTGALAAFSEESL